MKVVACCIGRKWWSTRGTSMADGTIKHSIIFPKSSKAFLVQPLCELSNVWPPTGKYFLDQKSLERIDGFLRIHRNAYVLFTASEISSDEALILDATQKHFIKHHVTFLPITGGASQCVEIIMDIIHSEVDASNMLSDMKKLCDGELDESMICNIIEKNLEVSSHDAMVLHDGCKTIQNIANAELDQLMECSLSVKVSKNVIAFFD
ncbi:uncharacterized protein LOC130622514 [Hydractinia symbiolongicarpus]|uniref:uncharacterized protein LOC130622514 n=1 Tax=Hydractinia symbiolongicarpus TaxID=13093 RepID=UPI00255183B8|nr:uncharacterized protein LOC130622514 [Hydractinia symbiolongicarpus]